MAVVRVQNPDLRFSEREKEVAPEIDGLKAEPALEPDRCYTPKQVEALVLRAFNDVYDDFGFDHRMASLVNYCRDELAL